MSTKREPRIFVGTAFGTALFAAPEAGDPVLGRAQRDLPHGADAFATPEERRIDPALETREVERLAEPPALITKPSRHEGGARSGLPLRASGEPRVAAPVPGRAWTGTTAYVEPLVAGLDPTTRRALGEAWLGDALSEHASIGAFAELAMALLALGAPADLLARTQHAAADEVEHARRCFALASAYLGASVGPGPLPAGPLRTPNVMELAMGSWRDGCLGEGAAAAIARAARRRAHDPAACAALTVISRDEAAHAELAWDVLAFCLERGGRPVADALREAAAATLTHAREATEIDEPEASAALTALLAEHGRLSTADRARCAAESARTSVRRAGWLLAPGKRGRPALSV